MLRLWRTMVLLLMTIAVFWTTIAWAAGEIDYRPVTASTTLAAVQGLLTEEGAEDVELLETVQLGEYSYTVDRIRGEAFKDCTKLQRVRMPDTIIAIGQGAFRGCTELNAVRLSESLAKIEDYLFFACGRMQQITIPDSVQTIGKYAFQDSGLTSIVIPAGVSKIGQNAFRRCQSLQEVYFAHEEVLPEMLEDDFVFTQCTNLAYVSVETTEMAEYLAIYFTSMRNVNPEILVRHPAEPPEEPPAEGGTEEPPAEGGTEEPPAEGGTEESSAEGGTEEPSANDEEKEQGQQPSEDEAKESEQLPVIREDSGRLVETATAENEWGIQRKGQQLQLSAEKIRVLVNWLQQWQNQWRQVRQEVELLQQKFFWGLEEKTTVERGWVDTFHWPLDML